MSNDIVKQENELAHALEEGALDDLIRPLTNEIHLFDTVIAGTSHLEDKTVLEAVTEGDKVRLQREDNEHDSKAILVLDEEKRKLGYVPEKDNLIFSRLMDAGKLLIGKIKSVKKHGSYTRIEMGIYLVDY